MAAAQGQPGSDCAPYAGRLSHRRRHQPGRHRPRALFDPRAVRDPRRHTALGAPGGRAHRRLLLLPARRGRRLPVQKAPARDAPRGGATLQHRARGHLYGGRWLARRTGRRGGGRAPGARAYGQGTEDASRRQPSAGHAGLCRPRRVRRTPGSMTWLRSGLFALAQLLVTPPYALIALATFPLPRMWRYRIISGWSRLNIWLARALLGIDWRVEGREHLPDRPAVILAKHQSAWETMAFQLIFPPQVLVLKRELLWIPFFGWGLALTSPIAIDRSRGVRALNRMAELGRERLAQGFWIAIFPEGTRVKPGERRKYHEGGAWLAVKCGASVVPVAHNAGLFWGRNAFLKRPGTVTVEVGPPIDSRPHTPESLNLSVEEWIEGRMASLCPQR